MKSRNQLPYQQDSRSKYVTKSTTTSARHISRLHQQVSRNKNFAKSTVKQALFEATKAREYIYIYKYYFYYCHHLLHPRFGGKVFAFEKRVYWLWKRTPLWLLQFQMRTDAWSDLNRNLEIYIKDSLPSSRLLHLFPREREI